MNEQTKTANTFCPRPLCRDEAQVLLKNPDRGLRMETYITLGSDLCSYPGDGEDPFARAKRMFVKYEADSPTLCQVYVYLCGYANAPLDDLAFSQLKAFFALFRANGIRMLLRFTYSTESVPDAPYRIVRRHLAQLKEWFESEQALVHDTLYCLQTGIIGLWGEGHSYRKLRPHTFKKVIASVCELAPQGIYTQVRTDKLLRKAPQKYLNSVGIHDDYIIGNMYHPWAFIPASRQKRFLRVMAHARQTVNDGEMPWGRATLDDKPGAPPLDHLDGKKVLKQLAAYSLTSFSLEHNYREEDGKVYSMQHWQHEMLSLSDARSLGLSVNPSLFQNCAGEAVAMSVYDVIRYHLGYLLVLSSVSVQGSDLALSVTNYGFAPPLGLHYLAAVCRDGKVQTQVPFADYDPKTLLPGKTCTFHAQLPPGAALAGVRLADSAGGNICARFANAGGFENGTLYFE